jgi:colicin import membrane protein
MSATMRSPIAPVGWSIALHAVLGALLVFGLSLPKRAEEPVILPIDAVVVDDAVLQAAGRQRDDRERVEAERRRAAEAEAAEQEEIQRQQQAEADRRQAEEAAQVEAAERAKADAAAKLKAESDARRKAEKDAAAKAAADKKRAAADQRDRDAREADLKARLEDEETRSSAGFQSLKASYVRAIQAHVEQRWYEPPGMSPGLSCTITVTQIPGGDVVDMRFGSCNGNAAVRQSIENAVRNASPLPPPPQPALFEREIELVFTPKESRR